jgi:hypothetical protein
MPLRQTLDFKLCITSDKGLATLHRTLRPMTYMLSSITKRYLGSLLAGCQTALAAQLLEYGHVWYSDQD